MCEACTRHGTEDRCTTCRPRRTAEEREERRRNALGRSKWMVCERCDYLGPRFDRVGPPSWGDRASMVALSLFLCLGGAIVNVVSALRGFTAPACPRCEATETLWPAPEGPEPRGLSAHTAALEQQERQWFERRRAGLLWAIVTSLVAVPFPVAWLLSTVSR